MKTIEELREQTIKDHHKVNWGCINGRKLLLEELQKKLSEEEKRFNLKKGQGKKDDSFVKEEIADLKEDIKNEYGHIKGIKEGYKKDGHVDDEDICRIAVNVDSVKGQIEDVEDSIGGM